MTKTIAIVAPGAMGSAIAHRLTAHGARVVTLLDGRSPATRARAEAAGMMGTDLAGLTTAEVILSVVPPAEAVALATRLAPALAASAHKPIVVDCNAVDVSTVNRIAAIIGASGAPFLDAAIIGLPPKPGTPGPTFYFSGTPAAKLADLGALGLEVRVIDGPVGAASALKMSYAGITKGLAAIASAMVLAASRAGAADALYAELAASQPQLLQRFTTTLPDMFPKAYRWVAEMHEIATFAGEDAATARLYEATADFYQRLALNYQSDGAEIEVIRAFLAGPMPAKN